MKENVQIIPVSVVIPTYYRSNVLRATFESISIQNYQPSEIIIIDASEDNETKLICELFFLNLHSKINYHAAEIKGAAAQRNQGIALSIQPFIFFMDDDILLESFCIERVWNCMQSDASIGAVSAMISNQQYQEPGKLTAFMYRLMHGKKLASYAGMCIGPAWNLLPQDKEDLPEYQPVEWLNTTCTLYRKVALPIPAFSAHFTGYSMMEDLTLSLTVGEKWKLYNARTARIFHDSQPSAHKQNVTTFERMELINRYYVMIEILNRNSYKHVLFLFLLEFFQLLALFKNFSGLQKVPYYIAGKSAAVYQLLKNRS